MAYNPKIHNRRSIRLKGYNYAQPGHYYVTSVCQNRLHLWGEVVDGVMMLNDAGEMVQREWLALTDRFKNICLHEYVVMPNHFHGILEITEWEDVGNDDDDVGAGLVPAPTAEDKKKNNPIGAGKLKKRKTLGDMIGAFHSITTVEYIRKVKAKEWPPFDRRVWQRNYWEHIIRNQRAFDNISQYIRDNPVNWDNDKLY